MGIEAAPAVEHPPQSDSDETLAEALVEAARGGAPGGSEGVSLGRRWSIGLTAMAERKRYGSKLGKRAAYLVLVQVGGLLAMATFWLIGAWPIVLLGVIVLSLAAWTLLGTRYSVGNGVLVARSGPIRKRVPLRDITAVRRHAVDRGITLGLGTDLIGIEIRANALNVSPREAGGFVDVVRAAMTRPPVESTLRGGINTTKSGSVA